MAAGAHGDSWRLGYRVLPSGLLVRAPFIVIDTWALSTGRLSRGGYAIWHDVLLGQAFFWLPVLFYDVAWRQVHAPAR